MKNRKIRDHQLAPSLCNQSNRSGRGLGLRFSRARWNAHGCARTCKLELPDREVDGGFSRGKARLEDDIGKKREQDGG